MQALHLYVIAYNAMTTAETTERSPRARDTTAAEPAIGDRVRALREAMGLSLRDLAERSGVSAPMLSQVERRETSPTLAVAAKIAAGLELTLSQLLRLDEGEHVSISRAGERRSYRRGGHAFEELTPPLPGQRADVSLHALKPGASTGGSADPPMHEPGSRETAVVLAGTLALVVDGARHELHQGRQRHLRRRPSPPLRERRRGADPVPRRDRRRPKEELAAPGRGSEERDCR